MGGSRAQDACLQPESLHFVLSYKRLDRGTFVVPEPPSKTARHVEIDDATLDALLDGIDVNEGSSSRSRAKAH